MVMGMVFGPDGAEDDNAPSDGSSGNSDGGGDRAPTEVIDLEAEPIKEEPGSGEGPVVGSALPVVAAAENGILQARYIALYIMNPMNPINPHNPYLI